MSKLRDYLFEQASKIERSRINGGRKNRLCGNFNMSFEAVEGALRLEDRTPLGKGDWLEAEY